MSDSNPEKPTEESENDFLKESEQDASGGILSEFIAFLKCNKKWWLLPIIIVLLIVGVLVVLSSSALAPLIYPLF